MKPSDVYNVFIKNVFGIEYHCIPTLDVNFNNLVKLEEFEEDKQFLTTAFSPILLYEKICKENNFIDEFITKYNKYKFDDNKIITKISDNKQKLEELINMYNNGENEWSHDEPVEPVMAAEGGKRRLTHKKKVIKNKSLKRRSKFKTFKKKVRTNKKKTHKRRK